MSTITNFSILGERCSGTNFLEEVISNNFIINYVSKYGNKHFFCNNNYSDSDNTLFIGIVRNPIYWLNSFSRELYHVPEVNRNLRNFLFNEFYSVEDEKVINYPTIQSNCIFNVKKINYANKNKVNVKDLNYLNGRKYKNIFELRKVKNDFLMNVMNNKVKNYILINYEDLLYNFESQLEFIKKKFNLLQRYPIFINVKKYKKADNINFKKQRDILLSPQLIQTIWQNLDKEQEEKLGYKINDDNNHFKTLENKQKFN